MTGSRLVADVGGTNTRLGLSRQGVLQASSVKSVRNDAFTSFGDVLDSYQSELPSDRISDVVIAVAGPVSTGKARLTNRDWSFDETQLSARFAGAPAKLLNDLAALGQACLSLGPKCLDPVFAPKQQPESGDQALVIGVGTGFNVSPVLMSGDRVANLDVEYGHISLPTDIAKMIEARVGAAAETFETVEHVFSGRGYAALSAHGPDESKNTTPPQGGSDFQTFYAQLLASLARNLMLAFLPRKGMYFAGGVARSVLSSPAKTAFADMFQAPFTLNTVHPPAVHTILDDAAALKGCAAFSG